MTKWYVEATTGNREVQATDWRVEGDFIVFFKTTNVVGTRGPREIKVFATKAAAVAFVEQKQP